MHDPANIPKMFTFLYRPKGHVLMKTVRIPIPVRPEPQRNPVNSARQDSTMQRASLVASESFRTHFLHFFLVVTSYIPLFYIRHRGFHQLSSDTATASLSLLPLRLALTSHIHSALALILSYIRAPCTLTVDGHNLDPSSLTSPYRPFRKFHRPYHRSSHHLIPSL